MGGNQWHPAGILDQLDSWKRARDNQPEIF